MSYIQDWDVDNIHIQVRRMMAQICSGYNDGFTQWGVKQDLYRVKWFVDQQLQDCPKFAGEEEWVRQQEQAQIINKLKQGS